MTGTKICLASATGLETIFGLGFGGIEKLGLVGLLLTALIVIWRDGKNEQRRRETLENDRQARLEALIKSTTSAITLNTEVLRKCHDRRESKG